IRNFVTSSHYLARLHETKAQVLYPPCKRGSEPAPLGMNHGTAGHSPELPLNPDRDRTRLVFCGRLEPIKGGQDALRVIKLLPDRYRLEILGEGPERAALEGLVNQWHLGPRVRFHGWTPPVERDSILASAGVLLIPSLTAEGFSMAGIEAAAQGTPVVAYRVGGIPEWCIPGAGVLVECGNVAAAAQAVKNLTDDAGRWEKYSQSARWVAEHKFPEHRFAQDVACLLKRVENMPMHSSSLCHQPAAL
ncbi:MAG TPA: glycosyltransferase, partial [Verrucomicrobiae bacterium]|nr:glycosyltransferase [Verrucomicrobiae bacterium]